MRQIRQLVELSFSVRSLSYAKFIRIQNVLQIVDFRQVYFCGIDFRPIHDCDFFVCIRLATSTILVVFEN